jgi:Fur family ferric uptake transcriptional regulator
MVQHRQSDSPRVRQSALSALRGGGLRVTGPRELVLDFLIRNHGPFTIDEIRGRLHRKRCNRVTIYRCIAVFERLKLVRRCDFGDDKSRYEYIGERHHHHIICRRCRRVEDIDVCIVDSLSKVVAARGYTDISHNLEFFGICPACQSSRPPRRR